MMRLPLFDLRAPRTLDEAARVLDGERETAMVLAGGTDLIPNMKRRQQVPKTLISLRNIEGLRHLHFDAGSISMGPCVKLSTIEHDGRFLNGCSALSQAASQVATPHIRYQATLGGNICLDTRCLYYDQTYEWRKAINFCMKTGADTCWVAPGSDRCMAVSSTDTAPALIALDARITLKSVAGERDLLLADLYNNDGMHYVVRQPNEILSQVRLDSHGWKSTYWKLRRRGSFDFPVLGVAAAAKIDTGGVVEDARIVLGAVASRPIIAEQAAQSLVGRKLDFDAIEQAASLAARLAKPLDNTDFNMSWRKRVTTALVTYALRELRGDDLRSERRFMMHQPLAQNGN
ncbi:MAG: FAD binding domain-containing protein [Acidobacteriota bacterium]|nr:FAD binding domain-containing protein [Acidobacteriota bacterium]